MPTDLNSGEQTKAPAMLSIFDGDLQPFRGPVSLRVHNGQEIPPVEYDVSGPDVRINVPFHDGPGDFYAVSVSSPGYRDGGCFFKADPKVWAEPKILLLKDNPTPQFLPWSIFKATYSVAATFLETGGDEPSTQAHYEQVGRERPNALASLLNLTQAMAEIDLSGRSPLSYFKAICWDSTMAQDRFYGYVDPALIPAVRTAAEKGEFSEEKNCAAFHQGATCSWKQIAFPVANVQLTFHEHDTQVINGLTCVKIEPDIDLYKELLAHGFGEVFPNLLTHSLTNPFAVFSLRWTTAQDDGGPAFNPGYELG